MDEDNVQRAPPGFHVIFLPFAEDMRNLDVPEMEEDDKGNLREQPQECAVAIPHLLFFCHFQRQMSRLIKLRK